MKNFESIDLKFNRYDFEDIYFKDGKGDIFFGQTVKGCFIMLLVFTIALILSTGYSALADQLWGIPIVLFFIFLISLYDYKRKISPTVKWKKQVNEYLSKVSTFKSIKISLGSDAISFVTDNEEIITKWSAFTKATINEEFITLISVDVFLFPKKSMTENEYQYLKDFIRDKFKNERGKITG